MPIIIDIEKDLLFQKGEKIGQKIGTTLKAQNTIVNMLLKTDFDVEQIADLVTVDIALVQQIQLDFQKTDAKAIFLKNKTDKNLSEKQKNEILAKELIKMPSLESEAIAMLCGMKKEKIEALRKELTKFD